ncbi:hypothetical protein [Phorcysia thermohydrogeniphila]|uniref:Preprotein translocase subunit SecB n=1 Tax=Phorcysia thermohydrogeniphila TaxID=936138 RepID=A0A4R1GH96_9BACT|nr:hypothetical protein [Phorcysia thermohydrogeniphila]TCK05209.1 hypothetical protein CLV27_0635 [Phorcysia thermohydrogeniphila]
MKAMLSPLQVKDVRFKKLKLEENPQGIKKDILDIDFEIGVAENGWYAILFKLKYNLRAKNPLIKADLEVVVFFEIDKGVPEDKKEKLLLINGLVITYGLIRGVIYQMCSVIPPSQRILPSVNFLPLIKEKLKKEDE